MRRLFVRLAADRLGGAVVEFAILAPVLFTIVLGGIDFGYMFYVRGSLEYATEDAARYYTLNPTTASSNVTTYLRGKMPGGMGPSVNVSYLDTTSCNSNANVTCTTITATYVFAHAGYAPLAATTLRATAKAVRY
jgi:Flp pilus assembly protein TadG